MIGRGTTHCQGSPREGRVGTVVGRLGWCLAGGHVGQESAHASSVIPAIVVTIGVLATSVLPAAQTPSKDVSQKASETGQAIKDYTVEKKDEAVAHAKKITADLDAKIKELEAQASKQTGEIGRRRRIGSAEAGGASQKVTELGRATRPGQSRKVTTPTATGSGHEGGGRFKK
jgi:hypothetical protein